MWWRRKKGRSECLCLVGSVQFSVRHIVTEVNFLNTKTRTRCFFDLAVDMDIEHFIVVHGLDNDDNGQGREKTHLVYRGDGSREYFVGSAQAVSAGRNREMGSHRFQAKRRSQPVHAFLKGSEL